jgi:hypothetical protein
MHRVAVRQDVDGALTERAVNPHRRCLRFGKLGDRIPYTQTSRILRARRPSPRPGEPASGEEDPLSALAILILASMLAAPQKPAGIQKATHAVEWTAPAGRAGPHNTSGGQVPGFDVVKLALASDGSRLTITATLKDPMKGDFASDVVQVYLDTDNDPKTGYETFWSKKPGFDLLAKLMACIRYENGGSACSGGLTGAKVKAYYAVATLGRFTTDGMNPVQVIGAFDAPAVPFQGAVLSASLGYKDLGVKPGQAIRIVARMSDGPFDATADFPEVILTLK